MTWQWSQISSKINLIHVHNFNIKAFFISQIRAICVHTFQFKFPRMYNISCKIELRIHWNETIYRPTESHNFILYQIHLKNRISFDFSNPNESNYSRIKTWNKHSISSVEWICIKSYAIFYIDNSLSRNQHLGYLLMPTRISIM